MKNTESKTELNIKSPVWLKSCREVMADRQEAEERFQKRLFPLLCLVLGFVVYIAFRVAE